MLESYKESQEEFVTAISASVCKNNKISHAYLIDTNGFAEANDLVLSFAKFLLCKNHNLDQKKCELCNLCSLIDNGVDEHILFVRPDGLWIKKEQLLNIKNKLSKKSLDGMSQIYIIEEAEKLNKAASNSLLKFLEEPEEGIIAILVTNNRYKLLPTILSRCQIYSLKTTQIYNDPTKYQYLVDFIMNLERDEYQTICYIQNLWHNKYKNKDEYIENFNRLESFFLDVIHCKVGEETKFPDFKQEIDYIISKNTESNLVKKLSKILECKEQIIYNVNLSLLMDKFIIEYVGGDLHD